MDLPTEEKLIATAKLRPQDQARCDRLALLLVEKCRAALAPPVTVSVFEGDANPAGVAELGTAVARATGTERLTVHLPASPGVDHHTVGQAGQHANADLRRDQPLMLVAQETDLRSDILFDKAGEQVRICVARNHSGRQRRKAWQRQRGTE